MAGHALLRLYPSAWRERYGEEFAELLLARPPSLRDRIDIFRGAVDARLHPQVGRAPAEMVTRRDRSAGALIIVGGLLLTAWAVVGMSMLGRSVVSGYAESSDLAAISSAFGALGAFLMAIALLLLASRYDQWIGSAGAVGGVLTGAGLVFGSLGGGIAALLLLGVGTVLLAVRIQGRLVGRATAFAIAVATALAIGAFLAVAANGWQDITPFSLLVLYGPAWVLVGLDIRVPVTQSLPAAA